jgi:hypothetical protein
MKPKAYSRTLKIQPSLSALVLSAAGALGLALNQAQAQSLSDPTRPPLEFRPSESAGAAGLPSNSEAGLGQSLQLQALFLRPGSKIAIINGVRVKEGAELDGWRVSRIETRQVVLRKASETQTLYLNPAVQKITRRIGGN